MKSKYAITFSLLAGLSLAAFAQTTAAKTLTSFDFITYGAVVAISTAAGSLVAIKRYLDNDQATHPLLRVIYEVLGSNCCGFVTFLICEANNLGQLYTMGMVFVNALAGVGGVSIFRKLLLILRDNWAAKP
jgi:hypothetical protein